MSDCCFSAPFIVTVGITSLSLIVSALFVFAVYFSKRSKTILAFVGVVAWLAATGFAASSGWLAQYDRRPPPLAILLVVIVVGAVALGLSPLGKLFAEKLPLWALVGFQVFRLPLEFVLREAGRAGVAPVQLTMNGFNFDVVTGATALILAVALYTRDVDRSVVFAWNVMGTGCLLVIAAIAIATAPFVLAFGQDSSNEWVTHFPFVWLPAVLVFAAILGHVVVFRKIGARNEK